MGLIEMTDKLKVMAGDDLWAFGRAKWNAVI